ncbi:formylglycine-generating enzyme family protein [Chloroflexota bacterium]
MAIYHRFHILVICFGYVWLLGGCGGAEPNPSTPIIQNFQKSEIQATPSIKGQMDDFQIRPLDGMRMNHIPGGRFQMGSSEAEIEDAIGLCRQYYHICNRWYYERESPLHSVTLDSFWIDRTEISNAQYRLCVEAGICSEPSTCKKGEPTYDDIDRANHPVVCVNWEDAQNYCQWVGTRLPTEAEWEYAFRGEDRSIYPWASDFDGTMLNYCDQNCDQSHADQRFDDGYPQTAPTGSYPSGVTWSGIFNMSGNVSEWVSDWLGEYAVEPVINPTGPTTGTEKMIKGGSWFFHPTYCRGAVRPSIDPDTRFDYLGFRCASSPAVILVDSDDQIPMEDLITSTTEPGIIEPTLSQSDTVSDTVAEDLTSLNSAGQIDPTPSTDGTRGDMDGNSAIRPGDGMDMVLVPAGSFIMGSSGNEPGASPAEFPQHNVDLYSYWIDKTEVTNAQYGQCVKAGACRTSKYENAPAYNGLDFPAVGVSWQDAADYCGWVAARLPTEAEWEYAAKGVMGSTYPWGYEFDGNKLNFCDQNCGERWADVSFDDGYRESAPVGSYPEGSSWVGALDMSGNVWEWVWDWYADYTTASQSNPKGPEKGTQKVIRGGAWASPAEGVRTSYRIDEGGDIRPSTSHPNIGFRCVVPIIQETEHGIYLDEIAFPTGDPPELDGKLMPGEWDAALVESFADGSELYLLQVGDYLYLGIQANLPGMIAGNVFIHQGDEIAILHASAALGTAIYKENEAGWQQVQDFAWRCRSSGNSAAAQAERVEFFQDEGWLASNGRMGKPNELEYKITIPEQNFHLAVVFLRSSPPYEKVPWPADLSDDCIKPTPGGLPLELQFFTDQWEKVNLTLTDQE